MAAGVENDELNAKPEPAEVVVFPNKLVPPVPVMTVPSNL